MALADQVESVVGSIPGAADVRTEQATGLPMISINPDRERLAYYGLDVASLHETLRIAMGGEKVGQVFEGDRRFDLVVRLPENLRTDLEALARLPLTLPETKTAEMVDDAARLDIARSTPHTIPLGEVAEIAFIKGPNQISRENGKRRVVATANVRSRDLASLLVMSRPPCENRLNCLPATGSVMAAPSSS